MRSAETIREQAAEHFLTLQHPDVSPEQIDAVFAWKAASPENAAAYELVQKFWHDGVELPATVVAPAAAVTPLPVRPRVARWQRYAMAACAALVATVVVMLWRDAAGPANLDYATRVGEHRRIELPDGSTVELGGASRLEVDYGSQARLLTLIAGEALFKVAKNPQRPFIVNSAGGATQATGTQFNVNQRAGRVTVAVLEGSVQVSLPGSTPVGIATGSAVTYTGRAIGAPYTVDAEQLADWRTGHLTFADQPLDAVVADLNRYSSRPIVLQGETLNQVRVTGSVAAQGIEEWVQALNAMAPVAVEVTPIAIILRPL